MKTVTTTAVNNNKLHMLNVRQTASDEVKPDGAINSKQTHTPVAHQGLISAEDFRLMMRLIKGMFHKGRTTAAVIPRILTKSGVIAKEGRSSYKSGGRLHG